MLKLNCVGLTCKSDLDGQEGVLLQIVRFFKNKKINLVIDHRIRKKLSANIKLPIFHKNTTIDLLLVLGGDGTMLRAIQDHLYRNPIFFGINMGHLGFLAEVPPERFEASFNNLLRGRCNIDERRLLKINIVRNTKKVAEMVALNEVVIHQAMDVTRLLHLKTEVARKKLATYYADGLIISTPTGSTAYSLSVGGPILHPQVEAVVIAPINPHSFSQKPIVIPNDKTVYVYAEKSQKKLSITIDGQKRFDLEKKDVIRVNRYPKTVRFARLYEESYYKTLRRKLGWADVNI